MMKYILLLLAFSTQVFASSSAVNPTTVGNTYGAQVTASASYTPTIAGLGTVASPSFYYWRVADRLFVHGTFTSGSVGGDANVPAKASWTGILTAGDFVNIAGNGESCTVDFRCRVSIVQVSY